MLRIERYITRMSGVTNRILKSNFINTHNMLKNGLEALNIYNNLNNNDTLMMGKREEKDGINKKGL